MAWRDALDEGERAELVKTAIPAWTAPMLATLTHDYFSDAGWIYERKLDGERCLVFREGRRLQLLSRNRRVLNDTYPELAEALAAALPPRCVVDGEVVAFNGRVTSFSRLQRRIGISDPRQARASGVKVYLYLFDILHLEGYDVTRLPQRRRKQLLKGAVAFADPLRYTAHRNEAGEAYHQEACRRGWEGIIAKDAAGRYVHGRSRRWLKFKCGSRQELVIGGYTEPSGSRHGFGALLLGYYEDGALRYAGRVGTGFDHALLEELHARLRGMIRKRCPFEDCAGAEGRGVHWVAPRLVGEVGFTEWTGDGRLRHPRFLGLREDKRPTDVVREERRGSG